jgi:hypothetical protein
MTWWEGLKYFLLSFHEDVEISSPATPQPTSNVPSTSAKRRKYIGFDDAFEAISSTSTQGSVPVTATLFARVEAELASYKAIIYDKNNPKHKDDQLQFWQDNQHQYPVCMSTLSLCYQFKHLKRKRKQSVYSQSAVEYSFHLVLV